MLLLNGDFSGLETLDESGHDPRIGLPGNGLTAYVWATYGQQKKDLEGCFRSECLSPKFRGGFEMAGRV
jgi:hypothetical protein